MKLHSVYPLALLLPVAGILQSCAGSDTAGITCERKQTTYTLVSYRCSENELASTCVDASGGSNVGTETYQHSGRSCDSLGYTVPDTTLSSSEIPVYTSPNGSDMPGATGYFANPSLFDSNGSSSGGSGSQGSCHQASIETCVDYFNMTDAKYNSIKNQCINAGLPWTDTLSCTSIVGSSPTYVCEHTATDASSKTFVYNLTNTTDRKVVAANCYDTQGIGNTLNY